MKKLIPLIVLIPIICWGGDYPKNRHVRDSYEKYRSQPYRVTSPRRFDWQEPYEYEFQPQETQTRPEKKDPEDCKCEFPTRFKIRIDVDCICEDDDQHNRIPGR